MSVAGHLLWGWPVLPLTGEGLEKVSTMYFQRTYVTEKGRAALEAELEQLQTVERIELIERLADAKTGGDWMDSAEHTLVEEQLAFVEARIRDLEGLLASAVIIPPDPDPLRINLGDTVVLKADDGQMETYTIVGSPESDPAAGRISNESPLGQALLSRRVGDDVVVHAPVGDLRFLVVALEPPCPEEARAADGAD